MRGDKDREVGLWRIARLKSRNHWRGGEGRLSPINHGSGEGWLKLEEEEWKAAIGGRKEGLSSMERSRSREEEKLEGGAPLARDAIPATLATTQSKPPP